MPSSDNTGNDTPDYSKLPYEVGNKKPPRKYMFQKGQSGNLSGRPKGRTPFAKTLMKEFYKQVAVVMDGANTKLGNNELFAKTLVKSGITKGPQSTALLLAQVNKYEAQLAAEAAAFAAKSAKEKEEEKPFSWSEEQDKVCRELEEYLSKESGLGDRDSTGDNSKDPSNEGPEESSPE